MPRFFPPHLMALVTLFIVVIWFMLLRHFRQSATMQKFVAETLGDDTPESALRAFELAKQRLTKHLDDSNLETDMRRRIELALGVSQHGDVMDSQADNRSFR